MTKDFTFTETRGANGFNYWIKGVGNLYPDDKCTDEKLALIATAPDLLEALEEAERIAQEPDKFRSLQERESAIIAWKRQTRAAIAKAKGEK